MYELCIIFPLSELCNYELPCTCNIHYHQPASRPMYVEYIHTFTYSTWNNTIRLPHLCTLPHISPPACVLRLLWPCQGVIVEIISYNPCMYKYYHSSSLNTTSTPRRRYLPTFTHIFSKLDPSSLSFPPWASALFFFFAGTFQVPVSKLRSYLPCSKVYYYPNTLHTHFFYGISLLASLSVNPLVSQKKSPMQYHTCVLYIITSTNTRKIARGSRRDKTFPGKSRKKGKKHNLRYPTLIRNSHWCVMIGQCLVGRRSERDIFLTPQKNMGLHTAINRVAIRACAYKGPCLFLQIWVREITTSEHQKPFTA